MNKVTSIFLLTTMLLNTSQNNEFTYQYEITASSNSSKDILELYNQKEEFLDKYNKLFEGVDEDSIVSAIKLNLVEFGNDRVIVSMKNGKIVLVIGEGEGLTINGHLKSNLCDENVINHKLYIIDWLFNSK